MICDRLQMATQDVCWRAAGHDKWEREFPALPGRASWGSMVLVSTRSTSPNKAERSATIRTSSIRFVGVTMGMGVYIAPRGWQRRSMVASATRPHPIVHGCSGP